MPHTLLIDNSLITLNEVSMLNPNRTVNVAIQVLPLTAADVYAAVDQAIAVIAASGVKYEVNAMETVMEGTLDTHLDVAKQAHLACLEAGAGKLVTIIKIGDSPEGTTIDEKLNKYRTQNSVGAGLRPAQ
jgi:uncharacterized protein YqgV (UPF0045/DUF77 family)